MQKAIDKVKLYCKKQQSTVEPNTLVIGVKTFNNTVSWMFFSHSVFYLRTIVQDRLSMTTCTTVEDSLFVGRIKEPKKAKQMESK